MLRWAFQGRFDILLVTLRENRFLITAWNCCCPALLQTAKTLINKPSVSQLWKTSLLVVWKFKAALHKGTCNYSSVSVAPGFERSGPAECSVWHCWQQTLYINFLLCLLTWKFKERAMSCVMLCTVTHEYQDGTLERSVKIIQTKILPGLGLICSFACLNPDAGPAQGNALLYLSVKDPDLFSSGLWLCRNSDLTHHSLLWLHANKYIMVCELSGHLLHPDCWKHWWTSGKKVIWRVI